MNLRSLDLNLLVILDALLDEAHVSRAADRVGLSQPATSSALQRCRGVFGDALLERTAAGMRLTPRAEALRGPLKTLLAGVGDLVDPREVPLAELRRVVRVQMADFPAAVVLPPLQRALAETAPGIDLVIQPWQAGGRAATALSTGECDIAVSVLPRPEADLRRETVLHETYRVAMRHDHPAAAAFDLDGWLAVPHVVVSGRGEARGDLDAVLAAMGRQRRVGLVVPTFQMVPALLARSEMMAMLPSRCLTGSESAGLVSFVPPVPVPGFDLHMGRHRRTDGDRAVLHVADCLRRTLG